MCELADSHYIGTYVVVAGHQRTSRKMLVASPLNKKNTTHIRKIRRRRRRSLEFGRVIQPAKRVTSNIFNEPPVQIRKTHTHTLKPPPREHYYKTENGHVITPELNSHTRSLVPVTEPVALGTAETLTSHKLMRDDETPTTASRQIIVQFKV